MKKWLKDFMRPKPINWKMTLYTFFMVCMCGFMGFISGYYAGTGVLPLPMKEESIVLPEITTLPQKEVVETIVDLPPKEYEEGQNCLDYAWDAFRALSWKGQPSLIVQLELNPEPHHALLLVPTEENGWIFVNPRTGFVLKPTVGGLFNGKTIISISVLKMEWMPIDEFLEEQIIDEAAK